MKQLISGLLALLLTTPAYASNTGKLIGIATLATLDLYTSEKVFELPNKQELNPLLPKQPTTEQMVAFGVAGVGLLVAVDRLFEDSDLKTILFDSVIATEKRIINSHISQLRGTNRRTYAFIVVISGEF